VTLATPVAVASAELARFGWDSEVELVTFTRADALRIQRRYAAGTLSAEAVAQWAEAVEGRDDIGREVGFAEPLTEFLFELATPEVAGPLTPELLARWTTVFGG
jgi:hypothetical protein